PGSSHVISWAQTSSLDVTWVIPIHGSSCCEIACRGPPAAGRATRRPTSTSYLRAELVRCAVRARRDGTRSTATMRAEGCDLRPRRRDPVVCWSDGARRLPRLSRADLAPPAAGRRPARRAGRLPHGHVRRPPRALDDGAGPLG